MAGISSSWVSRFSGIIACVALAGCSSSAEDPPAAGGGTSAAVAAPDRTTWEATFKKDATVLDAAVIAKLKNPTADDGVYRFDVSVGDVVAKLPAGRAVLLTGVDIVRVKSVTTKGDEIVLTTERASLPDVVEDGKASWDIGIGYAGSPAPIAANANGGLRLQAVPTEITRLTYNGPVGMFEVASK